MIYIIACIPYFVSNHNAMFVCQLTEVLQNVLGDQFLGIYSIMFSPGSVLVNSVVRLSSPPSDSDISNIEAGLTDTFARNGFIIDQIFLLRRQMIKVVSHLVILMIMIDQSV